MGKHCLQLVLTLLPLLSPYEQQFSKQTDEKNPCWAVFSIIFKMVDTTNACQLYRLLSPPARQEAIPFLFCCYVTYRIVYHIVATVSGYISYHGKMYPSRPTMRHNFWPPPMSLLHVMYHTCSNHHSVNLFHPHPKIRLQALLLLKAIGPTLTPGVSKDCDGIESKYLGWGMRAGPAAPPASCLTLTAIIPRPLSHFSFVCTPTFHKLEITLWGLKWQVYRAP